MPAKTLHTAAGRLERLVEIEAADAPARAAAEASLGIDADQHGGPVEALD